MKFNFWRKEKEEDHILFSQQDLREASEAYSSFVEIAPTWEKDKPLPANSDFAALARLGWLANSTASRCIKQVKTSLVSIPLEAKKSNTRGETKLVTAKDPLYQILQLPDYRNPSLTFRRLLADTVRNLLIGGTGFWNCIDNDAGSWPVAIQNLRPDFVQVQSSIDGIKYFYSPTSSTEGKLLDSERIVRFIEDSDPLNPVKSLSPTAQSKASIDADNLISRFIRAFFSNQGIPAGVIHIEEKINPKEEQRLERKFATRYGGDRAFTWAVMGSRAKVTFERLGVDPRALDLVEITKQVQIQICSVFGVPFVLAQISAAIDASAFSVYRQSRRMFYLETVLPLAHLIQDQLQTFAQMFSDQHRLEFNFSKCDAILEDAVVVAERALKFWDRGLIHLNRFNEMIGEDSIENGDQIKLPYSNGGSLTTGPVTNPESTDRETSKGEGNLTPSNGEARDISIGGQQA